MPGWLYSALGAITLLVLVSIFVWVRAYFAHRKLQEERKAFSEEEIASDYELWDKFYNWYFEPDEQIKIEDFEGLAIEKRQEMLAVQLADLKKRRFL